VERVYRKGHTISLHTISLHTISLHTISRQSVLKAGKNRSITELLCSALKTESTGRNEFGSREQARLAVFDFIECFYHPHRRHSSTECVLPVAFETFNNSTPKAPPSRSQKSRARPQGDSTTFQIPHSTSSTSRSSFGGRPLRPQGSSPHGAHVAVADAAAVPRQFLGSSASL
jgi:hypothetical protein